MNLRSAARRSVIAESIYGLFDPVPFGCFVAALIFDGIYSVNAVIFWVKGAAWLIFFGLLFAIAPRLVNLVRVWITFRSVATRADRLSFWLNLFAIALAIVNAFVHTRDAYAVVPAGVLLSACSVFLMAIGHIFVAVERAAAGEYVNE